MNSFDSDNHVYRIAGKIVFSVTEVVKSTASYDDSWYTPACAERGQFIHEMTAMYDRNELDESSLDVRLVPYFDAWKAFRKQMPVTFTVIEQPFFSSEHGFAGTIDRGWIDKHAIVGDIKSGAVPDWVILQLAGYSILWPALTAMAIQLKDNGKFSLVPFGLMEMAQARSRFMEALTRIKKARCA